jgi:hypothetical protein
VLRARRALLPRAARSRDVVMMGGRAEDRVVSWLLAGDPSVRWQVMRDLHGAPRATWQAERARVAEHGWGARLLAHRDEAGRWTPRYYGRKWISTTYSMVLLRRLGLPPDDPRAAVSCKLFLDEGLCGDGGIYAAVTHKQGETCLTGMVLALLSWFRVDDPRRERLVDYLLAEQMKDGGWNCQRGRGAVHGSFHTTINVLSSSWPIGCTDPTGRARSSTPRSRGSRFPRGGTTTCSAPWTTSGRAARRMTRGSRIRSG